MGTGTNDLNEHLANDVIPANSEHMPVPDRTLPSSAHTRVTYAAHTTPSDAVASTAIDISPPSASSSATPSRALSLPVRRAALAVRIEEARVQLERLIRVRSANKLAESLAQKRSPALPVNSDLFDTNEPTTAPTMELHPAALCDPFIDTSSSRAAPLADNSLIDAEMKNNDNDILDSRADDDRNMTRIPTQGPRGRPGLLAPSPKRRRVTAHHSSVQVPASASTDIDNTTRRSARHAALPAINYSESSLVQPLAIDAYKRLSQPRRKP